MNTALWLDKTCGAIEALIHAGEPFEGLFPSIIDRTTGRMLETPPKAIEGQRECDRSPRGCNLRKSKGTGYFLRSHEAVSHGWASRVSEGREGCPPDELGRRGTQPSLPGRS